jgi:putative ABC transport system permease protein
MMRSAARSVLASRGRFLLTGTAITLSVAFLVATLVLSDSMRGRAASDIAEALAGTDAVVQGVALGEPGGGPGDPARSVQQSLDPDITERVATVDGVDGAAPQWVGFAKLVVDGSSVGTGTASDVGRNWVADPALNPFRLTSGRPPTEVGEIVIDRSLADDAGVAPGDVVQVLTTTGMHDATITGVATFASADAARCSERFYYPTERSRPGSTLRRRPRCSSTSRRALTAPRCSADCRRCPMPRSSTGPTTSGRCRTPRRHRCSS